MMDWNGVCFVIWAGREGGCGCGCGVRTGFGGGGRV